MFPEMVNSDIVLTNAKIVHGPEISEHAVALLLALTRNLHYAVLSKERADWTARDAYDRNISLIDKTALVVGLGGIGTGVAEKLAAFGMRVLAVDPKDIPYLNAVEEVVPPDRLDEILPEADAVIICAPLTPETREMFNEQRFSLMKPGAYLVNVSRGKIVDTNAMVAALESGRLAGVGLDVVDPEPLPPDHALWKLRDVIITPHLAGTGDSGGPREFALIKDNVRRFGAGLPLRNIVDKRVGY
jgi:phosphoglycerate dehydrogenase-like enzyme